MSRIPYRTITALCLLASVGLLIFVPDGEEDVPVETTAEAPAPREHMTLEEIEAQLAQERQGLHDVAEGRGVTVRMTARFIGPSDMKLPVDFYGDDAGSLLLDMERRSCHDLGDCVVWERIGIEQDGLAIIALGTPQTEVAPSEDDARDIAATQWGLSRESPLLTQIHALGCTEERLCLIRRVTDDTIRVTDQQGLSQDVYAPRRT